MEAFLKSLDLEKFAAKFKEEDVDMEALKKLSEDDLKDLGLTLGARKKIHAALHPTTTGPAAGAGAPPPAAAAPPSAGAAAGAAALSPAAAASQSFAPITGLFKAKFIEKYSDIWSSSYTGPAKMYIDPVTGPTDDEVCGADHRSLYWLKRSVYSSIRQIDYDVGSLTSSTFCGRGAHLAIAYLGRNSAWVNSVLVVKRDNGDVVTKIDHFDSNDRIRGLAFATDTQLCSFVHRSSADDEAVLLDVATGEPITTERFGVNVHELHTNEGDNQLASHGLLPNIVLQSNNSRVQVLDIRQGLKKPAQTWPGAYPFARFDLEWMPAGGDIRVVVSAPNRGEMPQVWEMRHNKMLFKIPKESASYAMVHKNVVVGVYGDKISLWDLTKHSGGDTLGAPVKTFTTGQMHGSGLAMDDKFMFLGSYVASLHD